MGHLRMMSAVQPFLSGAISKTVNLPEEATVEEIVETLTDLGLEVEPVTTLRGLATNIPHHPALAVRVAGNGDARIGTDTKTMGIEKR